MFTHTLTRGWQANGGTAISKLVAVLASAEFNLDDAIAAATTNKAIAWGIDVSQIQSLFITSDLPLTIKTNSSGSPVNTITLAANVPFIWIIGDPPLRDTAGTVITTDITSLFVTNANASVAANLQIRCLVEPA